MNADLIHQKFNIALQLGCNFASMRLPGKDDVYFFYASKMPRMQRVQHQAADKPLFFCSPYAASNMAYTFNADAVFFNDELIFGELPAASTSGKNVWFENPTGANFLGDAAFYQNYVSQIVNSINKDKFDKVVAARCEHFPFPNTVNYAQLFADASAKYPDACIYFFSMDGVGTWLGATPEQLLTLQKGIVQTVALAGTLPTGDEHQWTDKEFDEQGMIEFFIDNIFKQNSLKNVRISEVETLEAGNIKHLCSKFSVKLKEDILEAKLHKLIGTLNPTPAVCGLPQFEASLYISQNEKMERRFYSGFVGMQLPDSSLNLYVNLRCAELFKDHALLYAGAGITANSDTEMEWRETQRKLNTMKDLFNN